jgi:hypothetical protein
MTLGAFGNASSFYDTNKPLNDNGPNEAPITKTGGPNEKSILLLSVVN